MNDQKEVSLALRVALEAVKAHTGCAPEECGGSRLDPCALGNALDDLLSYQRAAGYVASEKRSYMSDDCLNCAPLLAGASLARVDGTEQNDACTRCGFQGVNPQLWILRTWVDVRRGDVVRMPGQDATAAEVMELTTLQRHVNDILPGGMTPEQAERFARDVQYRPNEHAGEWTARPVTLRPLAADDPTTRHRIPNVNPAAPVEIRLTQTEVDAIELLGGWSARVATAPYSTGGEAL